MGEVLFGVRQLLGDLRSLGLVAALGTEQPFFCEPFRPLNGLPAVVEEGGVEVGEEWKEDRGQFAAFDLLLYPR